MLETPDPATWRHRYTSSQKPWGSCLHLLPIPGRYMQGASGPWGRTSQGFLPHTLASSPHHGCVSAYMSITTLTSSSVFSLSSSLILKPPLHFSCALKGCQEEYFHPRAFLAMTCNGRFLLPDGVWGPQSVLAIRDLCRTRFAHPPEDSGIMIR